MAENFATKYRSQNVEEYVGNKLAVQKLLNRFASKTEQGYPSCVLISGASGCGKTTMARMLTKLVLCEDKKEKKWHNKEYLLPCNKCRMCQDLNKYIESADARHLYSVKELDSSRTGKVDEVRQFIEEASMPKMYSGYSIYIFDECHLITDKGQESMLKFTEDAPDRSIFLFCTTDPQKLIDTLKTRMDLEINIELPTVSDNVELMTRVSQEEGFAFEKAGLELIAVRSGCVYRKSLKLLEHIYRSYGSVRYEDVEKNVDNKSSGIYFDFMKYLKTKNTVLYTKIVHNAMLDLGLRTFVEELREFTKRGLYLTLGLPVPGVTSKELKLYTKLFSEFSNEEILALLEFLDSVTSGDIETKLLLLGYRGLSSPPKVMSEVASNKSEVNTLQGNERILEATQVAQKHKEEKQSYHQETVEKAQLSMEVLSPDQLESVFDSL